MARYIVSDIDGCLTSEASIPFDAEAFWQFAQRCREATAGRGSMPPITLCTGRPQPYVECLMKLLDIRLPAICENGAVIYTLQGNKARYGPGVTAEKIHGLRRVREFIEDEILPAAPGCLLQLGKEAQLSVFSEDAGKLPPLVQPIADFAREKAGVELDIKPSHFYLNISLKGVTKGAALESLFDELGAAKEQVVGIGDTDGDLPLRDAVGFFGCPANSTPGLKRMADYVSPHAELRGVLDILERPECRR